MPVSPAYREFVLEQLGRVVPVTSRAMFGGVGIYSDGLFFALIDDDTLYLKVDDSNRPRFIAAGMGPFRPFGDDTHVMQYYEVPADLLEEPDLLHDWVGQALEVARRRKRG
jgi:DNA transformation protein and related proteins